MVSIVMPYALTLIGVLVGDGNDFMAFAVFFTVIGVVWTFIAATVKEFRGKGLLALEAGHAVIWLLFNFSPELLGKAIGLVIALPIAILVGVVGLSFFRGLRADDSAPAMPRQEDDRTPLQRVPNIIYDGGNGRWQLVNRGFDTATYESDDGRQVVLRHAEMGRSGANTNEGYFHW